MQSQTQVRHQRLENSIDIITENLPWLDSAAMGIWLEAGSRDESAKQSGIAHFYEHMVFKGTAKFNPLETVYTIESKGGYINAFTSRENTCFYARCTADQALSTLEVLCSMVAEPLLDQESFDLEKSVILEEIRSADDAPDEQISDLFSEALWGKTGLGRPIAGTIKSVQGIQKSDLEGWQNEVLHSHRIVISAVGKVNHEEIVEAVEKWLAAKKNSLAKERPWEALEVKHLVKKRALSQAWVMCGTRIPYHTQKERTALSLFNALFGDGMSSRLFQQIREKHGLVYSIYSSADYYYNHNAFNITFSADGPKVAQTLDLISEEISKIKKEGILAEELDFAKHMIRGSLLLGLEAANARMNRIARQVLYGLPLQSPAQTVEEIFEISLSDMEQVIDKIFVSDQWSSAWLGPKSHVLHIPDHLKF